MLKVLVTDGITSAMSDQEIVDFVSIGKKGVNKLLTSLLLKVKEQKEPSLSAKKLVDVADQLHSEDNTTALVIYNINLHFYIY